MELAVTRWPETPQSESTPPEDNVIVLLHGLAGTGKIWRPIAAALEMQFHILAPDQRGHGQSRSHLNNPLDHHPLDHHPLDYHPLDYAQDLNETLTALDIRKAWIVGHSMGARTAAAFAHLAPGKTKGLMLIDINLASRGNSSAQDSPLYRFLQDLPEQFPSREELRGYLQTHAPDPSFAPFLLALAYSDSQKHWVFPFDKQALLKTIEQSRGVNLLPWLKECDQREIPVLILRGEKSKIWTLNDYQAQKAELSHCKWIRFESFKDAGHGLPFEKRQEFIETLKRWVESPHTF